MSCRHDLANTTCSVCHPDRGGLDSNGKPQITPKQDGIFSSDAKLVIESVLFGGGIPKGLSADDVAWLQELARKLSNLLRLLLETQHAQLPATCLSCGTKGGHRLDCPKLTRTA